LAIFGQGYQGGKFLFFLAMFGQEWNSLPFSVGSECKTKNWYTTLLVYPAQVIFLHKDCCCPYAKRAFLSFTHTGPTDRFRSA